MLQHLRSEQHPGIAAAPLRSQGRPAGREHRWAHTLAVRGRCRERVLAALAPALTALAQGRMRGQRRCRKRGSLVSLKDARQQAAVKAPANLYDLLGVSPTVKPALIKQAYHEKMKVFHPDVAGQAGEEMCMLLNDAYGMLSDPKRRSIYDEQVISRAAVQYDPSDTSPTWKWQPKMPVRKRMPEFTGRPFSKSRWDRVPAEGRGSHWSSQKFVYVDEWSCISCGNCCDAAPRTFCIDADSGRARVHTQWGNGEECLSTAVQSCPVDCIHWVDRQELQAVEFITRRWIHTHGDLPCQLFEDAFLEDVFTLAGLWMSSRRAEQAQRSTDSSGRRAPAATELQGRIRRAFDGLSEALRRAGWGR